MFRGKRGKGERVGDRSDARGFAFVHVRIIG
jgi:hypothetical protein